MSTIQLSPVAGWNQSQIGAGDRLRRVLTLLPVARSITRKLQAAARDGRAEPPGTPTPTFLTPPAPNRITLCTNLIVPREPLTHGYRMRMVPTQ